MSPGAPDHGATYHTSALSLGREEGAFLSMEDDDSHKITHRHLF